MNYTKYQELLRNLNFDLKSLIMDLYYIMRIIQKI